MNRLITAAVALCVAGTAAAEQGEPSNQTALRERWQTIVTIDGDLRRDGVATAPAMPLPDWWGQLRLTYIAWAVAWDGASPVIPPASARPRDETLRERREEATLAWRQNLGTPWLTLETVVRGAKDDRTGDVHLGDLEGTFVIPLWLARYQAVAVALGALTPVVDDSRDWIRDHGSLADSSVSGLAEVRVSLGIELATLQVRARAEYTPHGHNRLPGSHEDLADRYLGGEAAVALTYRLTRWLRLGAELVGERREWRPRDDSGIARTHVVNAPLVARLELTPWPGSGVFLEGWCGVDLATRSDLGSGDSLVAGGSLTWVY